MTCCFVTFMIFLFIKTCLLTENIHHSKRILICSNEKGDKVSSFETIVSSSVQKCIESCKASKRCEYINYNIKYKTCSLLGLIDITDHSRIKKECVVESIVGYAFGNKSEWNPQQGYEACRGCTYHGVCVSADDNSKCETSGCGVPAVEISDVKVYGNMFNTGNKVNFECKDGFDMKISDILLVNSERVTAECKSDGIWTYPKFVCEPRTTDYRNIAHGKTVKLSSQYDDESPGYLMVDGDRSHLWPCACTKKENFPWAVIDLGLNYKISHIFLANRLDCCPERLHDLKIYVGITALNYILVHSRKESIGKSYTVYFDETVKGRYVKLQIEAFEYLTICELEMYSLI